MTKEIKLGVWYFYLSDEQDKLDAEKCGKWLYFFKNQEFARSICKKAVDENICYQSKCTNLERKNKTEGVACFYLNADDIENHKRVIQFMLDNDLIPKTKAGIFYNMSFKLDSQTRAGEYGSDFEGKIRLESFIDLKTGKWLK